MQLLKDDLEIYVLTGDRDLGDEFPFLDIQLNSWLDFDKNIKVNYLSKEHQSFSGIKTILNQIKPDIIYLNSMFSIVFTIFPLLIYNKKFFNTKLIIAPRGMLQNGAMKFKYLKKKIFLSLLKITGKTKNIYFHATDTQEKQDIIKHLNVNKQKIIVIGNISGRVNNLVKIQKNINELNLIFISRIAAKKNLHYLLKILLEVKPKFKIWLTICGGIEDESYWESCYTIINKLPANINVNYLGTKIHEEVQNILNSNHLFSLPTKGENFGHAIFESLAAGRPVLISDQTPWKGLETKNAGWDLPLKDQKAFVSAIEKMAVMDQNSYDEMCKSAHKMAENYVHSQNFVEQYKGLFSA